MVLTCLLPTSRTSKLGRTRCLRGCCAAGCGTALQPLVKQVAVARLQQQRARAVHGACRNLRIKECVRARRVESDGLRKGLCIAQAAMWAPNRHPH